MANAVIAAIFSGDPRLTEGPTSKVCRMFTGEDGNVISVRDADSAKSELLYPSILGGNKIVSVCPSLFGKEFCVMLSEIAESIPPSCMALCSTDSIDRECSTVLKKIADGKVKIFKFGELNGFFDAVDFVKRYASDRGGRIEPDAAKNLVSIVGHDDASALISEIEKLFIVTDNDITCDAVSKYTFETPSFRFFKLYTALASGDMKETSREMSEHIASIGAEAVDMSISKLLAVCCRLLGSFSSIPKEVYVDKLNRHWWGKEVKKIDAVPSKFMIDCASKIIDRMGNGVQSLMAESSSDMLLHRMAGLPYPEERLYLKAAAICLGGRKHGFDTLRWDRSIADGDGDMHH